MIHFSLRCNAKHEFEGWFRDGATFDKQAKRGQVTCPTCGTGKIEKAPMAPRLARSAKTPDLSPTEVRKALVELRQHVEKNCDYVGPRFAEEARRIHYGETKAKGIYGESTPDEAKALAEEGIEVARIPWVPPTDA
jgi:hypothetical protein